MKIELILKYFILFIAIFFGGIFSYQFGKHHATKAKTPSSILTKLQETSKNIAVTDLSMLHLQGPIQAYVGYGDEESVEIITDDTYRKFIKVEAQNEALSIQFIDPPSLDNEKDESLIKIHITTPNKLKRIYTYKNAKTEINNVVSLSLIHAAGTSTVHYTSQHPQIQPLSVNVSNAASVTMQSKHINLTHLFTNSIGQAHAQGINSESLSMIATGSSSIIAQGRTHFLDISAEENALVDADNITSDLTGIYSRDYAKVGIGQNNHAHIYAKGDSNIYTPKRKNPEQTITAYTGNRASINTSKSLELAQPAINSIKKQIALLSE